MGRIKGTQIKRVSKELMKRYKENLSVDFEVNKQFLNPMGIPKKTKNSIAGYIARKIKMAIALEKAKAKKAQTTQIAQIT